MCGFKVLLEGPAGSIYLLMVGAGAYIAEPLAAMLVKLVVEPVMLAVE
jgi:hypothetical protein